MATRIKLGDCYAVLLPDERYAYCQYVQWNEQMGYLIRVYDRITAVSLSSVAELASAGNLFPPVFVGLRASVKSGRWKHIGNLPVSNFHFPTFRATGATKPGIYESWWLWDGEKEWFIGRLPKKLHSLEQRVVWGDELLEERIATGRDPFGEVR
ncbi:MAG: Imm26 family immunity protein [Candidatus Sulfotelmatobacter sp.]